jgi:Flp pilus assembly protein TadD
MSAARCLLLGAILACAGCAAAPDTDNTSASAITPPSHPSRAQRAVGLALARATRQAGDLPSAIQLYRNFAQGADGTPAAWVELGDTLIEARQYDDAIEAFGRAEGTNAKLGAMLGMVRAHMAMGEATIALSYADKALALAPDDMRVLVDRGATLDSLQRHAEAQQSYRAALALAPRSVSARNDLALSLALTGQFAQAIRLIAPLARSGNATPKIRENLALILGLSGDDASAAKVSRMDLDEVSTADNLTFFAQARTAKP